MVEVKTISEIIASVVPYYKGKGPETEHKLVYDSTSETLEPSYFFILDLMNDFGLATEKLTDNFISSPGSGHFGELGQRATIMQQQATRILGDVNAVVRSVLNLVYDLKDFKMRLQYYDDLKIKEKSDAARMALKQIWLDKVDIGKGNSSIKALAAQAGFTTLIDGFLIVKDEKLKDVSGKEIDINDRIKRILKPRIHEFNIWLEQSGKELRKRYELERTYLKSQVDSLKLYSRWAKPYLKAAQELEMMEKQREPALVKMFSTILLELTLFGKSKINLESESKKGNLPVYFQKLKQKRNYYTCILVDFKFRGIPRKVTQRGDYVFGGLSEIIFKAYALNDDEIAKINKEVEKLDIEDVLKMAEWPTASLEQLEEEINFFLEEKEEEEKEKSSDESNPFLALFGIYNKPQEKKIEKSEKKEGIIRPEDWNEKSLIRPLTAANAADTAFDLFDIYKKAHGMPSYT